MPTSPLIDLVRAAPHIFLCGNGGSYANAMHIANDLIACGKRAYTLDPATLTAFANDYGYEHVFSRWLFMVGERGDLLIALSGSGRSPNIRRAIRAATEIGMEVWKEFGAPKGLDMQAAEEAQIALGHELMRCLRQQN